MVNVIVNVIVAIKGLLLLARPKINFYYSPKTLFALAITLVRRTVFDILGPTLANNSEFIIQNPEFNNIFALVTRAAIP